ncbi:MAG: glycosyltransferase family 2 protein [Desulfatibacillaceae bacterium]
MENTSATIPIAPCSLKPAKLVDVSVIMPAHAEEQSVGPVLDRVRQAMDGLGVSWEVIVVDDGSPDRTGEIAAGRGARVLSHPYNIGNGAAVKTGIRNARGKRLVLLDADGQHPPERIPDLLAGLDAYDMVVGARTRESASGAHRNMANALYNRLATYVSGRRIEDLTSGFRALRARVAREFVNLLPNTFSYPSTLTLAVLRCGYSLAYIPVTTDARKGKSKIKLFRDGARFLLIIMKIATMFAPMRIFLPVSLAMFLTGLGWGLYKVFVLHTRYGPTSALLMTVAVLVFLIGLVSEQVAQLRVDHKDLRTVEMSPPDAGADNARSGAAENAVRGRD